MVLNQVLFRRLTHTEMARLKSIPLLITPTIFGRRGADDDTPSVSITVSMATTLFIINT